VFEEYAQQALSGVRNARVSNTAEDALIGFRTDTGLEGLSKKSLTALGLFNGTGLTKKGQQFINFIQNAVETGPTTSLPRLLDLAKKDAAKYGKIIKAFGAEKTLGYGNNRWDVKYLSGRLNDEAGAVFYQRMIVEVGGGTHEVRAFFSTANRGGGVMESNLLAIATKDDLARSAGIQVSEGLAAQAGMPTISGRYKAQCVAVPASFVMGTSTALSPYSYD
jgi:hypothetical protein